MVLLYCGCSGSTGSLKKENLRDNMTNEELVLNMLAELSTTSITKSKNPQTLENNMQCAADGGDVARVPSPVGRGLG